MRILVIWGESLAKPGGGTVHGVGLVRGWLGLGHQVTLLSPVYKGQTPNAEVAATLTPIRLGRRGLWSFARLQFLMPLALPWWIHRYRPDVIYVRTCFLQGLMALYSRLVGVPIVGEVDGLTDTEIVMKGGSRFAGWAMRVIDRVNNLLTSAQVCVSQGLREEMIRRWARPATTPAIPNGATSELMKPGDTAAARRELGLSADETIVSWAGTMAPWQGLDLLVRAAAEVTKSPQGQAVRFVIMGDGSGRGELEQWIAQHGLEERFVLLGPGSQQQVRTLLDASDATVIPINVMSKVIYACPLKFFDSISMGLPTLTPQGMGFKEILADLNLPGEFAFDDEHDLAKHILEVAQRVHEFRPRRQEIHQAVADKYSWTAVARRVAAFFDELINRKGRSLSDVATAKSEEKN